MTEERLLKELYKVQQRVIGWLTVGLIVGLILGWIMGVTIGEMHSEPSGNPPRSNIGVLKMDRSDLGSLQSPNNTAH